MRPSPFLLLFCMTFSLALSCSAAHAQINLPSKVNVAAETETPKDLLGRDTPRGTLKGYLNAVTDGNYEEAAQYLDLSTISRANRLKAPEIAADLQTLLDRQGWIQSDNALSDKPEGHVEDELGPDLDNIASLRSRSGVVPINLRRTTGPDGNAIWLFAPDFVETITSLAANLDTPLIDRLMVGKLDHFKIHGAPATHWLTMIGLYVLAYMIAGVIVRPLIRLARWIFRRRAPATTPSGTHLVNAFELPLRLYAMVGAALLTATIIGISVIVRHAFMPISMAVIWMAMGLFLWRLANVLMSHMEGRMKARERYNMSSLLAFTRRAVKLVAVVIVIILILDSFGVNVTAALAALGIGGIALALGAQKTLENFIGSLSIIIDQPIHVGDPCKVGDVTGVVEDIGMRSTRIRTNERTLVTIPNGALSTQGIENLARRSRFLINRQMILRYDSTSAQIRDFIARVQDILNRHEKIVKDGEIARLLGFSDMGFTVQIWCYVQTSDGNEFLRTQAAITYDIIDAARDAGVYFAIPSQTFLPAKDQTGKGLEDN